MAVVQVSCPDIIPFKATKGSAAYDLQIPEKIILLPEKVLVIDTRVKIRLPNPSYFALLLPRSSTFLKYKILIHAGLIGTLPSERLVFS